MVFIEIGCMNAFMNGSHGSKYQFVKQAPVKQLSTNHL